MAAYTSTIATLAQANKLNKSGRSQKEFGDGLGTVVKFLQRPSSPLIVGTETLKPAIGQQYTCAPVAASNTYCKTTVTLATGATTTVTTFAAQPDVCRVIVLKGNAASVAGDVVVSGLNFNGAVISETVTMNGTAVCPTLNAYSSLTSVVLPAKAQTSDGISIGVSSVLGIPFILENDLQIVVRLWNGAADTGGALVADAVLSKNLYTSAGTAAFNGVLVLSLFMLVA
jgi:hypothetical protein